MNHLPWKLLGAALFLGIAFDILFKDVAFLGLNVLLFEILLLGTTALLYRHVKQPIPHAAYIPGAFALAYAATFAIWTSELGLALSTIGLIIANLIGVLILYGHHATFKHPIEFVYATVVHSMWGALSRIGILDHLKLPGFTPRGSAIARGIAIAIPILIVFAVLFVNSDLLLKEHTESIGTWLNAFIESGDFIAHLFLIGFISVVFFLIFAATFWKRLNIPVLKEAVPKFTIESSVILGSSVILFLLFLAFESVYLFGGEAAWKQLEGVTYSEYAVHGFNELAAVAMLVLALILSVRALHTERRHKWIEMFEGILIVETLFVVISAWMRMQLYVEQYGFTPARLFGFWFFLVVSAVLILLGVHIFRHIEQSKFMKQGAILVGSAMLIFTMLAPDALAVRLNVNRATVEHPVDPFPLFNNLSAEAYPNMREVLMSGIAFDGCENGKAECHPLNNWYGTWNNFHYEYTGEKGPRELKNESWRTWNLSRSFIPYY